MTPSHRLVRDLMTRKVAILHEEENLALAERGMNEHRFRHLPVVEGDKLIGLVTESDLLRASISSLDADQALRDDNLKRYIFVREVMTLDVITVRPDALLVDAARLLWEKKLGCLPVTEEDGTLVGIVTQSDFLALTMAFLHEQEVRRNSGTQAKVG